MRAQAVTSWGDFQREFERLFRRRHIERGDDGIVRHAESRLRQPTPGSKHFPKLADHFAGVRQPPAKHGG